MCFCLLLRCLCMFAVDVHALLVLLMCFYMFVVEVHGIWSTTKMHLVAGPSAFSNYLDLGSVYQPSAYYYYYYYYYDGFAEKGIVLRRKGNRY